MVQLNNGILMPQFGLGTFFQPSDSVCEQSCLTALKAGYRHIDTAHAYNDEAGVGRGYVAAPEHGAAQPVHEAVPVRVAKEDDGHTRR